MSREKAPGGAPAFEAIVIIGTDPVTGGRAALWLDSTGNGGLLGSALGQAPAGETDRISFVFTPEGATPIHNTFVYDAPSDGWRWILGNENEAGRLSTPSRGSR